MKSNIAQFKADLKQLATQIRTVKILIRQKRPTPEEWQQLYNQNGYAYYDLLRLRYTYRHMHIAYCMLRGRTLEQIENKVAEDNKPDVKLVEQYMAKYPYPVEVQDATNA